MVSLHRLSPEAILIRRQGSAAAQERRLRPDPMRAAVTERLDDIAAQEGPEAALHVATVEALRLHRIVFANVPQRERARSLAERVFAAPNENAVGEGGR